MGDNNQTLTVSLEENNQTLIAAERLRTLIIEENNQTLSPAERLRIQTMEEDKEVRRLQEQIFGRSFVKSEESLRKSGRMNKIKDHSTGSSDISPSHAKAGIKQEEKEPLPFYLDDFDVCFEYSTGDEIDKFLMQDLRGEIW